MTVGERPKKRTAGTAKPADRADQGTGVTTERDVGTPAETPVPPVLPLDDDGNDARNIGG